MQTKITKKPKNTIFGEITMVGPELAKYFEEIFTSRSAALEVKGFRPGKAPRLMLIEKIGANTLISETLDLALNKSFGEIIKKEDLKPVAPPKISIKKWVFDPQNPAEENNVLEYNLEIAEFPTIKLGDYQKIKLEKALFQPIKVTDEDVEKVISQLRKQQAKYTEVERPARKGDLAETTYQGSIKGVVKENLTSQNQPVELGSDSFVPGFTDELVGLKKGEEKTFSITFPKDYYAKDYAGEKVEFKVKVELVKEIELPLLDEKFAAKFGHKNPDNLKKAIKESVIKEKEEAQKRKIEAETIEKALKLIEVEAGDLVIEEEQRRALASLKQRLESQGAKFEQYLQMVKKDEKMIFDELKPQAIKNIQVGLMLGEIAKQEKITGTPEEMAKKALDFLVTAASRK